MPDEVTKQLDVLHDQERLQELADLDLGSPEVDTVLQELAQRAANHFGLPIGLVSVVLDEAQYFAARYGVGGWMAETRGTPVEWSFCRIAVETRDAFIVEDAQTHPLVMENPLVRLDGIRCYAGIPMISSKGHALGSFCVIGPDRRHFSEQDVSDLRGFAVEAVRRIEARRKLA